MKILVDTQAVIWFYENNPALSKRARQVIEDSSNLCYVSLASFWEISIKMNLGKLHIKGHSLEEFMKEVWENGFFSLEISEAHILQNGTLPFHHHDPFDRMIISQAISEGWKVVSIDEAFDAYGVQRIW